MCDCYCGKSKTCLDKQDCYRLKLQEKYNNERENGRPLETTKNYRKPIFIKDNLDNVIRYN